MSFDITSLYKSVLNFIEPNLVTQGFLLGLVLLADSSCPSYVSLFHFSVNSYALSLLFFLASYHDYWKVTIIGSYIKYLICYNFVKVHIVVIK